MTGERTLFGSNLYLLDDENNPVETDDVVAWGQMMQNLSKRLVAVDMIDGTRVSTVFLGMDHGFGRRGPPVLWETMVFGPNGGGQECERYRSLDEAKLGHALMIARVLKRRG